MLAQLEPRFIALREHVLLVEKSLFSLRPNNSVTLPHAIRVRRAYDTLVFTKNAPESEVLDIFEIRPGKNVIPSLGINLEVTFSEIRPGTFPAGKTVSFFDGDRVCDLSLRTFRKGDRFTPLGMARSVKLKDYFMARKLPAERRLSIPLLLSDGDIIWVVGERMDERYKVTPDTRRFLKVEAEALPAARAGA
jgi:tRNA(Ile)-lysidine synthase